MKNLSLTFCLVIAALIGSVGEGFEISPQTYAQMRVRTKDCHRCNDANEVLYRVRYQELKDWVFLCGKCLTGVKTEFEDTYQYGGTWKSKKK